MRASTAILAAMLALSACGERTDEPPPATPPAAPEPLSVTYICAGGAGAEARYGGDGQLTLVFGDSSFPMHAAEAVSGSRWTGESLEWWVALEAGEEVGTLRQLGPDAVGREVVARCVRPTAGGVLAPEPGQGEPEPCRAEDLDLRPVGTEAGAGQRWATLALRNRGQATCTLEGYPSLSLEGEGGAVRTDLNLVRTPGPYYAQRDIAVVALDPDGEAFFDLGWTVVAGEISSETEPCRAVTALRAGPAGATPAARAELEAAPCGGRVRLSPIRPTVSPEG